MKHLALVGLVAGFALAAALLIHFGLREVGAALSAAGATGLAAISLLHLVAMAVMGVGWWALAAGRAGTGPQTFVWGRLMRDAGSEVLPLSQVGGYVLGARAVALRGVGAALAAATTIADVTLELCGQVIFTLLGLVLLIRLRPQTELAVPVLIGLGFALVAVAGFLLVQRRGAKQLERLATRLARGWITALSAAASAVQDELHRLYARRVGVSVCFLLHLATWIGSCAEAWVALRLMGVTIGFAPVLAIESMLYAIRSVAFMVPNAIGVQEAAYVMLGAGFGITPDQALALSLLKRGRDLLLGIPPLLIWQLVETRRFWARRLPALERSNPRPD